MIVMIDIQISVEYAHIYVYESHGISDIWLRPVSDDTHLNRPSFQKSVDILESEQSSTRTILNNGVLVYRI